MKQYTIDFNHDLPHVTILVSNGAAFERALIGGHYKDFYFTIPSEGDRRRVIRYVLQHCNGHHISRFSWHAQCLGHSMGLIVWGYNGRAPHAFSLCTYRPHGRTWQNAGAPNREWIKYGSECQ